MLKKFQKINGKYLHMEAEIKQVLMLESMLKKLNITELEKFSLTSMDKDGTKSGYDVDLLKAITKNTNIPVIASGGVGKLDHLYDGMVKGGASAVLAASIFPTMANLPLKIQKNI